MKIPNVPLIGDVQGAYSQLARALRYMQAPFMIAPLDIGPPSGALTYTLPMTPMTPEGSFYFVNGVKKQFGVYYTISGDVLSFLTASVPLGGDTHELYAA